MKKQPKLHLVGQDPADIFQDLDRLRADMARPAESAETINGDLRPYPA